MVIKFGYKTYITIDYISFYIKSILEPIFKKIFGVCSVHQTMFHVNFPDGHAELLCLHTGSQDHETLPRFRLKYQIHFLAYCSSPQNILFIFFRSPDYINHWISPFFYYFFVPHQWELRIYLRSGLDSATNQLWQVARLDQWRFFFYDYSRAWSKLIFTSSPEEFRGIVGIYKNYRWRSWIEPTLFYISKQSPIIWQPSYLQLFFVFNLHFITTNKIYLSNGIL